MTGSINRFSLSRAVDARFESGGLRDFNEYRDLGIKEATGGRVRAYVSHARQAVTGGTGRHRHDLDFQMIYVLGGRCRRARASSNWKLATLSINHLAFAMSC